MANSKFTVAICGGGIAGLTAAIALSRLSSEKKDIRIDLYESAPTFNEIGAGVGMYRRPWKVMKALGLDSELRKLAEVPDSEDELQFMFEMRKADQKNGISFCHMEIPMGLLSFHRADYQRSLVELLDPSTVTAHFSKRLISYCLPPASSPLAPITLEFKDGSTAHCDVLVGADGIHSATRHTLLELAARELEEKGTDEATKTAKMLKGPGMYYPVWAGSVAFRAVIPREKLKAVNPQHRALYTPLNLMGKNKCIIVYPISRGLLLNVVASVLQPDKEGTIFEGPWVSEASKEELLEQYKGWEDEAQQILQCIEKPSRWAINTLQGLLISTHNRVALVGDAAHAMTPYQGSGAGQAIEDAYILAALLTHPLATLPTLSASLKIYEAIRLPHGNEVQLRSRRNGMLYMRSHDKADGENSTVTIDERLRVLGQTIIDNWKWAWETDLEPDRARAEQMLEDHVCKGR